MESQVVALIGIGCAFGVSLLATLIFLVLYARLKLKDDTNIRRRVIAVAPAEAKVPLVIESEPIEEIIEPIPLPPALVYPKPLPMPIPAPTPPPPVQPVVILEPVPQPQQPLPPPPPREPEVVVHEVIHRYEPAPAPPQPPPQQRTIRRRSWGGLPQTEDDWILVKRVSKSSGTKTKYTKEEDDSSSDDSGDEYETRKKRRHKKRLDRYDLATNFVPMGFRPQAPMMSGAGFMMAQPTTLMAPTMVAPSPIVTQPVMATAQPTYMPFFAVPR